MLHWREWLFFIIFIFDFLNPLLWSFAIDLHLSMEPFNDFLERGRGRIVSKREFNLILLINIANIFISLFQYFFFLFNSTWNLFIFTIKWAFLFFMIVIVRITTPRMKLESLYKLGWSSAIGFLLLFILIYFSGYMLS